MCNKVESMQVENIYGPHVPTYLRTMLIYVQLKQLKVYLPEYIFIHVRRTKPSPKRC